MKPQLRVLLLSWAVIAGASAVLLTSPAPADAQPPGCCEKPPLPGCVLVSYSCVITEKLKTQDCTWSCPGYQI